MKTLMLLRHAEASRVDPPLADRERPLSDRGRRAASAVGVGIRERGILPDVIIGSPARRTVETAALVAKEIGFGRELEFDGRIYEAAAGTMLEIISGLSDDCAATLLVGHNPGIEVVIRILTEATEPMPPGTLAVIGLDVETWVEAGKSTGRILDIIRPAES